MLHKKILGGEQYLPFALSRARAQKASGRPYSVEAYDFGDATVKIRTEQDHQFIRLEGGPPPILSGVVKNGSIGGLDIGIPPVSNMVPSLEFVKATEDAWKNRLNSAPAKHGVFYSEPRLAVTTASGLGVTGSITGHNTPNPSQYSDIRPCMFSGLMAKAVQIIMGYEDMQGQKNKLLYNWRAAQTHGIVKDANNTFWLVEIGADGVRAMKLRMRRGGAGKTYATRTAFSIFKGYPTGETFPTGTALTDALTNGTVLQLLTTADINPYLTKESYSSDLGWSFNTNGTEAHNTCYDPIGGNAVGYHYKIVFGVDSDKKLTASFSEVSHGNHYPMSGSTCVRFSDTGVSDSDPDSTAGSPLDVHTYRYLPTGTATTGVLTVLVFHRGDELVKVTINPTPSNILTPTLIVNFGSNNPFASLVSTGASNVTLAPHDPANPFLASCGRTDAVISPLPDYVTWSPNTSTVIIGATYITGAIKKDMTFRTLSKPTVLFARGVRDGIVVSRPHIYRQDWIVYDQTVGTSSSFNFMPQMTRTVSGGVQTFTYSGTTITSGTPPPYLPTPIWSGGSFPDTPAGNLAADASMQAAGIAYYNAWTNWPVPTNTTPVTTTPGGVDTIYTPRLITTLALPNGYGTAHINSYLHLSYSTLGAKEQVIYIRDAFGIYATDTGSIPVTHAGDFVFATNEQNLVTSVGSYDEKYTFIGATE